MKKNSTRLKTLKKKALELQTLCAVDVAFVYVAPDGQLSVFPDDPLHLRRLLDRYVAQGGEAAAIKKDPRRRRRKNNILANEGCSSLLLGGPTSSLVDAGSSSSSSRREETCSQAGEGHSQAMMAGEMRSNSEQGVQVNSLQEQGLVWEEQGEFSLPQELVLDMEEEGLVWQETTLGLPDLDSPDGQPQNYQLPSAPLNYAMDDQTQPLPSTPLNYAMDAQMLPSALNHAMDDFPESLLPDPDSCDCFDLGWLW